MDGNLAKLSYRDLAERLGISTDAARMKAKRKAKAGLWRVIPGNHPSDRVMVELPAADLAERVGGDQRERVGPERSARTIDPEHTNDRAERLLTALEQLTPITDQLLAANREANARISDLTTQLLASREAHAQDRAELAAAEMRELGTKAELERALTDLAALQQQQQQVPQAGRPLWRRLWA